MFLFELDTSSAMATSIVAVTDQLKTDLESGKLDAGMTTDQLLDYFQQYDVMLDVTDLYNMIKVPPLKDVISNIQGHNVVFKGQSEKGSDSPNSADDNDKIVSQMAKAAMKK